MTRTSARLCGKVFLVHQALQDGRKTSHYPEFRSVTEGTLYFKNTEQELFRRRNSALPCNSARSLCRAQRKGAISCADFIVKGIG